MYLSGLIILIASCFSIGVGYTVVISRRNETLVSDFVVYMLIGLLSLIFLVPVGRLYIYHIQLIRKGITTN